MGTTWKSSLPGAAAPALEPRAATRPFEHPVGEKRLQPMFHVTDSAEGKAVIGGDWGFMVADLSAGRWKVAGPAHFRLEVTAEGGCLYFRGPAG
jgi:hypothetical protein